MNISFDFWCEHVFFIYHHNNIDAEEARMDEDPDDNQDEQDSGNEDDESDYTGDQGIRTVVNLTRLHKSL